MRVEAELRSERGFYVGDICYVLDDDAYYGTWGQVPKKADGRYDMSADCKGFGDGVFEHGGHRFAVARTAHGDGLYRDSHSEDQFPVDAGVLGIVPLELLREDADSHLGAIAHGDTAVFYAENGLFDVTVYRDGRLLRHLPIDTRGGWDEDDEEDE